MMKEGIIMQHRDCKQSVQELANAAPCATHPSIPVEMAQRYRNFLDLVLTDNPCLDLLMDSDLKTRLQPEDDKRNDLLDRTNSQRLQ